MKVQHVTSSLSRPQLVPRTPQRTCNVPTSRAAGRKAICVRAEGQSLEASYTTGGGGGRVGAAQLREQPAEATQAALDAAAVPQDGGQVLQEAADYMRGELRRMFSTGVRISTTGGSGYVMLRASQLRASCQQGCEAARQGFRLSWMLHTCSRR